MRTEFDLPAEVTLSYLVKIRPELEKLRVTTATTQAQRSLRVAPEMRRDLCGS
jgi:hypothetical protein